jgi:hypothetical protein
MCSPRPDRALGAIGQSSVKRARTASGRADAHSHYFGAAGMTVLMAGVAIAIRIFHGRRNLSTAPSI